MSKEEESTEPERLDTPNSTSVTDLQSNEPVWSNQRACLCLHSGKTDQLGFCSPRRAGVTVRITSSQSTGLIYSPLYTIPLWVSRVHFLPSIRVEARRGNSKPHIKGQNRRGKSWGKSTTRRYEGQSKERGRKTSAQDWWELSVMPLPSLCLPFLSLSLFLTLSLSPCFCLSLSVALFLFLLLTLMSPRLPNALSFCSVTKCNPFYSFYFLSFLSYFCPVVFIQRYTE